jgi:ketosteroid isomerase-like protein
MTAGDWLRSMQARVRARDYAGARELFAADVTGFGTVAGAAAGLDELERLQWRRVWPRTRDFAFDLDGARTFERDGLVGVAARWTSTGLADDGTTFPRSGRATLLLDRRGDRLVAVHSHFSTAPAPPMG